MLYTCFYDTCPQSWGSALHCAPGVNGVWCSFEKMNFKQKSSLPPAKSSSRHHPICCRANRHHSNVPRFVSRCSCLVFHEVGWSSIACSKRLLVTRVVGLSAPPTSIVIINVFFLLLFRSIENIFLWKYINVCRQVEFLAHRARVDSNLWNLDRVCRHVEVHHVPVQWAGGG